jgi:hypothetical protein
VTFHIQDPGNPNTSYLIEILLAECQHATAGGASFAWASSRGINLLIENPQFTHFLHQYAFELIVGVDAVTDESALQALCRLQEEFPKFSVSVFLNGYAGSMFHPKVCWFSRTHDGALITGSGNLTEGGLSKNWEAFTVTALDKSELTSIQAQWSAWKNSYGSDLFGPSHTAVVDRAKRNAKVAAATVSLLAAAELSASSGPTKKALAKKLPGNKPVGTKPAANAAPSTSLGTPVPTHQPLDILLAEIPRGSSRWNQANFDLDSYENYFGAKVGTTRHMFFRHVNPDGTLANTETRPSVAVKSSNWRFELAAAAGLKYPAKGRPIAIFVKQASRNFLYRLVMPGDPAYSIAEKLLTSNWHGPAGRIKRVRIARSALEQAWPNSPLWKVSDTEPPNA